MGDFTKLLADALQDKTIDDNTEIIQVEVLLRFKNAGGQYGVPTLAKRLTLNLETNKQNE